MDLRCGLWLMVIGKGTHACMVVVMAMTWLNVFDDDARDGGVRACEV